MEKNFENEMKRRLGARELKPSADAWERVKLQRKRTKKRPTYIYRIAAILAIGFFATWIGIQDRSAENETNLVTREIAKPKTPHSESIVKTDQPSAKAPQPLVTQPEPQQNATHPTNKFPVKMPVERSLTLSAATIERRQLETQITSALMSMSDAGKTITTDDVDALIEKARLEIAAGRGLSRQTDAAALLKDSESELDENFRAGVFENLFKHKKIKIALSKP